MIHRIIRLFSFTSLTNIALNLTTMPEDDE